MSKTYEIKKSYISTEIKTVIVALVALLLFLTTSKIVGVIDNIIPANTSTLALLVRVTAFIVGLISVITTWVHDTRKRYYLENGRLIIRHGSIVGRSREEIITPPRSPKIRVQRTLLGSKLNYATILLDVDYFSRTATYELKNIYDPETVIAELTTRLHSA